MTQQIIIWLGWVAIEPENREILSLPLTKISKERDMLIITERFLSGLIKYYGKHSVSTDGGRTWYPLACEFLKLYHHVHSFLGKEEKSRIERNIQYIKDRTKSFDDYFSCCKKQNCKLKHVKQWIKGFAWHHNNNIRALLYRSFIFNLI